MIGACCIAVLLAQAAPAPAGETPPPVVTEPAALGLFRLGPVYLTPSLRIESIGIDTNVFYTATDRQTDFIAHGGPGLKMVVPLHGALRLTTDGTLAYLYYARTESQRRLTGRGMGRLGYDGLRLTTGAQYAYEQSFNRLGFEVNRRVAQTTQSAQADVHYRIGERFGLGARGTADRFDIDEDQEFFGSDLRQNLSRDVYLGTGELSYALTPKTSFIVEGDYQADRFAVDAGRDTDSNRLGGGFAIDSTTLLSGRAIAGARSMRVHALPELDRIEPYARIDLTYHFGPRTRLGADYSRDIGFSALSVADGDSPLLTTELARVRLEKGLWGRFDLQLHGSVTQLSSHAQVLLQTPTEGSLSVRRNDRWREAGADLGYAFWSRLRIGFSAIYSERRSVVHDLGIEGLLLGGTVTFIPD